MAPTIIKKAVFLAGSFNTGAGPRPKPAKVTKEKKEGKKKEKAGRKDITKMSKDAMIKELERLQAAAKKDQEALEFKQARIAELQAVITQEAIEKMTV